MTPDEVDRLYTRMDQGFTQLNARLDKLNGTVDEHGQDIAVLKDRGTRGAAVWGGGIGGVVVGITEAIRYFLGR